jgi:excisionase family DNA binding protein
MPAQAATVPKKELGRYMSVKEAAWHLGVSEAFIRKRLGKPGGPPMQRIGVKIQFPRERFLRWAEQPVIK